MCERAGGGRIRNGGRKKERGKKSDREEMCGGLIQRGERGDSDR